MQAIRAPHLAPEDLLIIETFLMRRSALQAGVRHRLAYDVLNRIRPKLGSYPLATNTAQGAEETLERIARDQRV